MSQAEICRRIGFQPTTWNNYELGRSTPNLEDFYKIIKFFKVDGLKIFDQDLSKGKVINISNIPKNDKKGNVKGNVKGNPINEYTQDPANLNIVAEPAVEFNSTPYNELINNVMSLENEVKKLVNIVKQYHADLK
ncbi:MAG: helix-turn-helix transcriptional regulator [Chitinophagaceae bacterium]|nr:helix-turn-helix transcriptional regulator [Chitinophagaceae bacterium]